jgi:hypothetical protein
LLKRWPATCGRRSTTRALEKGTRSRAIFRFGAATSWSPQRNREVAPQTIFSVSMTAATKYRLALRPAIGCSSSNPINSQTLALFQLHTSG